jgi:hypothetical protein
VVANWGSFLLGASVSFFFQSSLRIIVRVISIDSARPITYLLKAGKELNERNDRTLVSKVAYARHLRVEYLTFSAEFPHHFGVGHQYQKECD